jgi:YD repeat-containing protein
MVNGSDSVSFAYDKDGLLKRAGSLSILRNAQTGLVTADTIGSITSSRDYDNFGNLLQLTYRYGGNAFYQVTYTNDSMSRVASRTETIEGETTTLAYTYDTLGRISDVKRSDTLISHYSYDSNGNRDSVWMLSSGVTREHTTIKTSY